MKQGTSLQTLGHYKDNKASYEQLYTYKSNNLEEMNQFLTNYKLPRLNQDEISYLNSPITISKIGVNKKHPHKEIPMTRRNYTNFIQFLLGNRRDGNRSQLMLGS